jgi:hypothetical protein
MSCISPHAFATDFAAGSNVDSWPMSAATRYGSRSWVAEYFRIESQYASGKMTWSISAGSSWPPAVRNCGYVRRYSEIARRSSPFWL